MANTKGSSNIRNLMYSGKQALLPPKSPFPSIFPSYVDYVRNPAIGSKVVQNTREANAHHQRTSSESFLVEEKPSWLDDLLNEPDTPVYRGHRRSSSDSFTLLDATNVSSMNYAAEDDSRYRNMISAPSLRSLDSNLQKNSRRVLFNAEMMNVAKMKSNPWDSLNALNNPSIHASVKDNSVRDNSGSVCTQKEADGVASTAAEKHDVIESALNDSKTSPEKNDNSNAETDTKRAKQQFAQRSRVRKLQYISELERNVQTLQAEGSKVSAELKFLNQQNLILSMENKALKQRLENLAQEQLIKYLEQEVLEREIGRLRALYQQQRQPQASSSHRRTNSRDLDSQFSNLSLKHEDSSSGRDPMTGPLHI